MSNIQAKLPLVQVTISELVVKALEKSVKDAVTQCILECAKKYGFDGEAEVLRQTVIVTKQVQEDQVQPSPNMDKLFYYSKSANKTAGKGVNEYVLNYQIYEELNKIKDWRQILSNFYCHNFMYEDKTYNSVEHAFQSKKIEIVDKEKAYWFCKNSGHIIGISDGLIARKNRKLIILKPKDLNKWNDIKYEILYEILLSKFSQIPICNQVLLLTHNAVLLHGARGIPICRQFILEKVRNTLKLT
jgi:predicted NAD-dependent protein-ADP-ribosyltransferase YbiA (DUF1768 family)